MFGGRVALAADMGDARVCGRPYRGLWPSGVGANGGGLRWPAG